MRSERANLLLALDYAFSERKRIATTMKPTIWRVMMLVCLIVSVVELDWERDRIYLVSSLASLVLVVWSERLRRRKQKATAAVPTTTQAGASEACLTYPSHPHDQTGQLEKIDNLEMSVLQKAAE
jgi:hypothetical protein